MAVTSSLGQAVVFSPCADANSYCGRMPDLRSSCLSSGNKLFLTQTHVWGKDFGPDNAWTLRSLWDRKPGSNCASAGANDALNALESRKLDSLISDLNMYWTGPAGDGPQLWADEWNKHGACLPSLRPYCFKEHKFGDSMAAFLDLEMALFKSRPTYDILAEAGIKPKWSNTRNMVKWGKVLKEAHGAKVSIQCKKFEVTEVSYHWEVEGAFPYGTFRPAPPPPRFPDTCMHAEGHAYRPKGGIPSDPKEYKEWQKTRDDLARRTVAAAGVPTGWANATATAFDTVIVTPSVKATK